MQSEMIWYRGRKAVFVIGASSRGSEEPEPPVSCFGRLHVCTCVHTPPENSDECTPKGRERREWKVALTPMTFFCQDHSSDPPLVHAHSDLCLSLSLRSLLFRLLRPLLLHSVSWSPSQLSSSDGGVKPWTCGQFISGPHRKANSHSHSHFGLWEEAGRSQS